MVESAGEPAVQAAPDRSDVAARLHAVAIHLLRRVRREDPASGLGPARLSVLSVLVFGGPRTPTELAAAEQVTGPTMTRLLRGLEADGYVERTPSPTDGRSVIMSATPRARAALEEARSRRIRQMRELLEELGESEWSRLADATAVLEAALRDDLPGSTVLLSAPPARGRGSR